MKITLAQVGAYIADASESELKEIRSALQWRRDQRDGNIMNTLKFGQIVGINGKRTLGKDFRVIKINTKTIICSEVGNPTNKWKVSPVHIIVKEIVEA